MGTLAYCVLVRAVAARRSPRRLHREVPKRARRASLAAAGDRGRVSLQARRRDHRSSRDASQATPAVSLSSEPGRKLRKGIEKKSLCVGMGGTISA